MMFRLVVLCACALLLASCLPADPTGKPDFGPETPASEISAVLSEADQGTDPVTDVKLGQFVHYAETQVLNEQFGMVLSDTGLTIIKRDETPEQVTFTAIQNKITYGANGETRKATTEIPITIDKTTTASAMDVLEQTSAAQDPSQFKTFSVTAYEAPKVIKRTFHNFVYRKYVTAPPPAVVNDPTCQGIPNCQITVYDVKFDAVDWTASDKATRTTWHFKISKDVPYLAHELDKCMTFLAPMDANHPDESQKVKVEYCLPVVNFRFQDSST